jgi:phosphomannomutase
MGIDVTDLGFATTPTVEVAVTGTGASGGIIITASHNPANWNALKLLNSDGEFLSAADGEEVLRFAESGETDFVQHDKIGILRYDNDWTSRHIDLILAHPYVNIKGIREAGLSVVTDCINSVGALALPGLFERLGVKYTLLNGTPDGNFAHNPEPLAEHLGEIMAAVPALKADMGFVVDPDVDRLAIICEDGTMFGEEYTLVAVSDYILSRKPGPTVSNMSSSMALRDVTEAYNCKYYPSEVGEVNVVAEMKKRGAVIGGEGNGGIIWPEFHYGRDALAGIALFLSHFVSKKVKCSTLRKNYPEYVMSKRKVNLSAGTSADRVIENVKLAFAEKNPDLRDGIKLDFGTGWVHIRKSNTEPILRIYSEGRTQEEADNLASMIEEYVKKH